VYYAPRHSASLNSQSAIVARLVACGIPLAAIDSVIEVVRSGHVNILAKLIAGELTIEQARALARQRRR